MTFNQGNPYTRPARQMYVPLDTEDRILVERHYIPATVYRDLYNIPRYVPVAINNNHNHNHTHNPYNIFEPNRNTFFSNLPYPTPSTIPTTTHTPTHTPSTIPTTTQSNIPTAHIPGQQNARTSLLNTLNNLMNGQLPVDIDMQIGYFGSNGENIFSNFNNLNNFANANTNNIANGIPLSMINSVTNVSRICDLTLPNIIELCSICQINFNNTDICRVINSCSHVFHLDCIDRWLSDHNTCPCCRYILNNNSATTATTATATTATATTSNIHTTDNFSTIPNMQNLIPFNNIEDSNDIEDIEDINDQDLENPARKREENYEEEDDEEQDLENPARKREENYEEEDDEEDDDYDTYYEEDLENFAYEDNNINNNNIFTIDDNDGDDNDDDNITISTPRIFLNSFVATSNGTSRIDTQPIVSDINNLVNMSAPFINSFMNTSNLSPRLNPNQINAQVGSFFDNINPFLQAFTNIMGNPNSTNSTYTNINNTRR